MWAVPRAQRVGNVIKRLAPEANSEAADNCRGASVRRLQEEEGRTTVCSTLMAACNHFQPTTSTTGTGTGLVRSVSSYCNICWIAHIIRYVRRYGSLTRWWILTRPKAAT